jgi:hypothetical protein
VQELYVKGLVGRVFVVSAASELAGWLAFRNGGYPSASEREGTVVATDRQVRERKKVCSSHYTRVEYCDGISVGLLSTCIIQVTAAVLILVYI